MGALWTSERPPTPGSDSPSCPRSGCSGSPPGRSSTAAIRDQQTRSRTLTVYTEIRRLTMPLGISDRDTIWLFLVDRDGQDDATAAALSAALAGLPGPAAAPAVGPGAGQFEMAFGPRFRLPLAALGVTQATAHVTLTPDRLVACFGPWVCRTAPSNVRAVSLTGPYRWHRAIGPRLSLADHGLAFGTTTTGGVCLQLWDPVPGIDAIGLIRHPNLTLTVAEPERFAAVMRRCAAMGSGQTPPGQDGDRWLAWTSAAAMHRRQGGRR